MAISCKACWNWKRGFIIPVVQVVFVSWLKDISEYNYLILKGDNKLKREVLIFPSTDVGWRRTALESKSRTSCQTIFYPTFLCSSALLQLSHDILFFTILSFFLTWWENFCYLFHKRKRFIVAIPKRRQDACETDPAWDVIKYLGSM